MSFEHNTPVDDDLDAIQLVCVPVPSSRLQHTMNLRVAALRIQAVAVAATERQTEHLAALRG